MYLSFSNNMPVLSRALPAWRTTDYVSVSPRFSGRHIVASVALAIKDSISHFEDKVTENESESSILIRVGKAIISLYRDAVRPLENACDIIIAGYSVVSFLWMAEEYQRHGMYAVKRRYSKYFRFGDIIPKSSNEECYAPPTAEEVFL